MIKRDTGYYWIKSCKDCEWEIAHYFKMSDLWTIASCPFDEDDFYEIDEKRIERRVNKENNDLKNVYTDHFLEMIRKIRDDEIEIESMNTCSGIREEYSRKEKKIIKIPDYTDITYTYTFLDKKKWLEIVNKLKNGEI